MSQQHATTEVVIDLRVNGDRRSKHRQGRSADRRSTEANAPYLGSVPLDSSSSYLTLSGYHSKRVFDVVGASVALVVFAPVALAIAAAIRLTTFKSALVSHQRVGKRGEIFQQFTFRISSDRSRLLTPIGRLLHQSSLCKLPQLLNVLAGDMSIVGPQAHSAAGVHYYGPAKSVVLSVRPGVLHPRHMASDPTTLVFDQAELDIAYVADRSPVLDLRICADAVVRGSKNSRMTAAVPLH